jgi:hypothetical protein
MKAARRKPMQSVILMRAKAERDKDKPDSFQCANVKSVALRRLILTMPFTVLCAKDF